MAEEKWQRNEKRNALGKNIPIWKNQAFSVLWSGNSLLFPFCVEFIYSLPVSHSYSHSNTIFPAQTRSQNSRKQKNPTNVEDNLWKEKWGKISSGRIKNGLYKKRQHIDSNVDKLLAGGGKGRKTQKIVKKLGTISKANGRRTKYQKGRWGNETEKELEKHSIRLLLPQQQQ